MAALICVLNDSVASMADQRGVHGHSDVARSTSSIDGLSTLPVFYDCAMPSLSDQSFTGLLSTLELIHVSPIRHFWRFLDIYDSFAAGSI